MGNDNFNIVDFLCMAQRKTEEQLTELAIENPEVVLPLIAGWKPEVSGGARRFWDLYWKRLGDLKFTNSIQFMETIRAKSKVFFRPEYSEKIDADYTKELLDRIQRLRALRSLMQNINTDPKVMQYFEEVRNA